MRRTSRRESGDGEEQHLQDGGRRGRRRAIVADSGEEGEDWCDDAHGRGVGERTATGAASASAGSCCGCEADSASSDVGDATMIDVDNDVIVTEVQCADAVLDSGAKCLA